jgi:hypothetical protein
VRSGIEFLLLEVQMYFCEANPFALQIVTRRTRKGYIPFLYKYNRNASRNSVPIILFDLLSNTFGHVSLVGEMINAYGIVIQIFYKKTRFWTRGHIENIIVK